MKNCLRVTFALLVALGMAAPAQAGVDLVVTHLGELSPGVDEFIVTAVGTEGEDVASIANLNLTGAHQVWVNAIGGSESPVAGDLAADTFGNPAWEPFDSHLLINPGDHILSPGFGVAEANSGDEPTGQAPWVPANAAFAAFPGTGGHGDLAFTGVAPQITLIPFVSSIDILHVVTASAANLQVTMIGSSASEFIEFDIDIEIPEPSSIALLSLGLVALVGRRRRS